MPMAPPSPTTCRFDKGERAGRPKSWSKHPARRGDMPRCAIICSTGNRNARPASAVRKRSRRHAQKPRPGRTIPISTSCNMRGWKAALAEGDLPPGRLEKGTGLGAAHGPDRLGFADDKSIPTFARGELPHYAGINTFLKAPYIEDVTRGRRTTTRRSSASPSMAAPPTGRARASARRACARFPPSTRPTTTKWASICASR